MANTTRRAAATASAAAAVVAMSTGTADAEEEYTLRILNPLNTSVIYDNVGHSLGGGEKRWVPPLDSMGCYVLSQGYIAIKSGTAVCPPAAPAGEAEAAPGESAPEDSGKQSSPAVVGESDGV